MQTPIKIIRINKEKENNGEYSLRYQAVDGILLGNYGFNTNKLLEKLDIEVRNAKIVTAWQVMGNWTEFKYKDKIQALMDEYHMGYSRIEDIINMEEEEEE